MRREAWGERTGEKEKGRTGKQILTLKVEMALLGILKKAKSLTSQVALVGQLLLIYQPWKDGKLS